MDSERVQSYYDDLKRYYLKTDSDWTDKAKSFRTIAHNFYNELTSLDGKFSDALKEFYKWNTQKVVSSLAFKLKDELNNIVHNNIRIDRDRFILYYNSLVRLIYLATNVFPDDATLDYIGFKPADKLSGLNNQQKDAVLCNDKVIYVSAGPGTGKTYLLINKLLQYINTSTHKERIIALSFTNTAANELGDKFFRKAFESRIDKEYEFYNGTLHAFCFKMLKSYYASQDKEFNYIIIDEADIKDLADEIRIQLEDAYTANEIAECLKSNLRTKNPNLRAVVADIKKRYNLISIDDILTMFINHLDNDKEFQLWMQSQITILVVDEAQDLTETNYDIFSRLMANNTDLKIFIVGDPRQNIFGFNGGSYEHLDGFLSQLPSFTEKALTKTYRCPQVVVDYVNKFSFVDCTNLPLKSFSGKPGSVNLNSFHSLAGEAADVLCTVRSKGSLNKSVVLCNNLKYLATFIDILNDSKIPYKVYGGRRIVKSHIKLFNHIIRIIESDNQYSIKRVGQEFMVGVTKASFYESYLGQRVKDIKDSIARDNLEFEDVASAVVNLIDYQGNDNSVLDDYSKLIELSKQYTNVEDYLLAFAIDKDTFSDFYQKDYIECKTPVSDDFLTVSTIHSAKGLEWDNVFIMGMSDENFPNPWWARDKSESDQIKYFNDAQKAMYVAATRTRENLFLSYSEIGPYGYRQSPSRYLRFLNSR
ncbi:MAG: ATP-dependent helicase [Prevotella sp.]|nr:ATP-dependent helicase [Prevotella sp.]